MDPLNSLRKKFAVKRGSRPDLVSDSEHSQDPDDDDEQNDSFDLPYRLEEEEEEDPEGESPVAGHRSSVNAANDEPFPGTPDQAMTPFSTVTPDSKEKAPISSSPASPKPRMSFDKLPRPPKRPASGVKGDKLDKELGLNKDYWAEVPSFL